VLNQLDIYLSDELQRCQFDDHPLVDGGRDGGVIAIEWLDIEFFSLSITAVV